MDKTTILDKYDVKLHVSFADYNTALTVAVSIKDTDKNEFVYRAEPLFLHTHNIRTEEGLVYGLGVIMDTMLKSLCDNLHAKDYYEWHYGKLADVELTKEEV